MRSRQLALTTREIEVLELIARGMRNEIARSLAITEETVKVHVKNLIVNLGVHDRIAVHIALRRGIIHLS